MMDKLTTNLAQWETIPTAPDLEGFIDQDILDRFEGHSVTFGDIITAQQIQTMRELITLMKEKN